jgi:hypothetical protein
VAVAVAAKAKGDAAKVKPVASQEG